MRGVLRALIVIVAINLLPNTIFCSWTQQKLEQEAMMPSMLASAEEQEAHRLGWLQNQRPIVITLGDSQTMFGNLRGGWVHKLAGAYSFAADVINRGTNHGNSRGAMYLAQAIVDGMCPQGRHPASLIQLVTILLGSNDAAPVNHNVSQRVMSVSDYSSNLNAIITTFRNAGTQGILLITPPPFAEYPPSIMTPYVDAVKQVGQSRNVTVADFFSAVLEQPDWPNTILYKDKLHLSKQGNHLLYQVVKKAIASELPDIAPTNYMNLAEYSASLMEDNDILARKGLHALLK